MNDASTEGSELNQFYRIPFLELGTFLPPLENAPYPDDLEKTPENLRVFIHHSIDYAIRQARPRVIKTHLPLSFLPDGLLDKARVIFVSRNVKDMAVSYYYHSRLTHPGLDFKLYLKAFKDCSFKQTGMIPMSIEAWNQRSHPNMLYYTYEDMKTDYDGVAEKLKAFLGVTLTPEQDAFIKERTSFGSLKKNDAVNKRYEIPHVPSDDGPSLLTNKVRFWKIDYK